MSDSANNTDTEIWRGPADQNGDKFYSSSIHVTERGGIGINVGGNVLVQSVEDWHNVGMLLDEWKRRAIEAESCLDKILKNVVHQDSGKWYSLYFEFLDEAQSIILKNSINSDKNDTQ